MIKVTFKDLEPSQLAKNIVTQRLSETLEKFPEILEHRISVVLSSENTPSQSGPDVFGVKLVVHGKKFKDIILEKRAASLYVAVGNLCSALLEKLNRVSDKARVKKTTQSRRSKTNKSKRPDVST